jgi:poly(3-hydroxybutyrate) depolymerase
MMPRSLRRVAAAFMLSIFWAAGAAFAEPLPVGKSSFWFTDWAGPQVKVWTHKPSAVASPLRVVFVMHGVRRNGADYRDQWSDLAERHGFLLVVPEFDDARFPGVEGYNFGNTRMRDGNPIQSDRWSFTAIERIFDQVRTMEPAAEATYRLYGHSAGAQFVHRFLYFIPEARVTRVVVANAGWYTMPTRDAVFPYGLTDSGISEASVKAMLGRPVVIQLGDADIDPDHSSLRRTAGAMKQGPHRFARGHAYFQAAKSAAEASGVDFGWKLETVPGVAHSNEGMAKAAVAVLMAP